MASLNIDIPPLFKYAYRLFRQHLSFVVGVMSTYFVLGMIPQVYLFAYQPAEPNIEYQIISIVALMVQLFIALGFTKIMLYLVDGRPVEVNDLINNGALFLNYTVAYFIFFIAVAIGLVLFIVPGIYLAIRLQFYPYYIIEEQAPSFIALQKSWQATGGFILELVLFGACMLCINFVGALLLGIGVIVTYPITTMATAVIFRGLYQGADRIPTDPYRPQPE